jgi:hypothetical protein
MQGAAYVMAVSYQGHTETFETGFSTSGATTVLELPYREIDYPAMEFGQADGSVQVIASTAGNITVNAAEY